MKLNSLETRTVLRALGIAGVTALLTGQTFGLVFADTDFGWALSGAYDRILTVAERDEQAGRLRAAEQHYRHIATSEENRVLRNYALVSGDGYLVSARLRLGRVLARQGRLPEADAMFLHTLQDIRANSGDHTWRHVASLVRYSEFLLESERNAEARRELARAHGLIRDMRDLNPAMGLLWNEDEYGGRAARLDEFSREIGELLAQLDHRDADS